MADDVPSSAEPGTGTRKLGPRVSPRQMEMLVEFLNEHPYLASRSKEKAKGVKVFERERLWEEAAGKLNAKGPAVKSRASWRQFWSSRSEQIKRTVARVAKMREESKQLPRAPPPPQPPPPPPVAAEQGQLLFLLKQNGPCQPQRLLLPRLQQQVQLRLGTPGEAASVFVTANSPLPPAAAAASTPGTTPLQANGVLLEQHGGLVNGQPDPDTRPVVTEERFRAEMLQQTTQQTALLQGLLGEQRRIAEAAERQARALEEQSHAVSQLLLLMMGNQRNDHGGGGGGGGPSASDLPLALLTPDMVQVEHSGPDT